MGWMKIRGVGLWGDETQDLVDRYLKSWGFNYDRNHRASTIQKIYAKAVKSKALEKDFYSVFRKNVRRNPTRQEFLYHIKLALGRK